MVLLSTFAATHPRLRATLLPMNPFVDSAYSPAQLVNGVRISVEQGINGGIGAGFGGAPITGQSNASGGLPYR